MSIDQISLSDPTQLSRPIERSLQVNAVGDLAFVSVVEVDEGNPTTTYKTIAEMCVSLPTLRDAIVLLCDDRDRESIRGRDKNREPLPDLEGRRWIQVPV